MIKIYSLCLLMLSSAIFYGQNLSMTFSAAGAANKVDTVKATNLRTNESVKLPGNDTLVLSRSTGIIVRSDVSEQGIVFPNPFSGRTSLVATLRQSQQVALRVHSLNGQLLITYQATVQPGTHVFKISLAKVGVYMVSLTTYEGTIGFKIICTESGEAGNTIRYAGIKQGFDHAPSLKETTIYTLGYQEGDIILYRCKRGIYITIVTDSPTASKNYPVDFELCKDPDGRNYAIVNIGDQTWMAENLAWLPKVSTSATGSDSLRHFYVYGYEDTIVAAAKSTLNYNIYGVLYNWPAAILEPGKESGVTGRYRGVCPSGWHIPYDEEWKVLETNLGMSWHDADSVYLRNSGGIGTLLKSSTGWNNEGNGSNASGFTALPGGYRNTHGGFLKMGDYGLFWTGTQSDTISWYRSLNRADTGVYRLKTLRSHGFSIRCIKDAF
jgi:uncharacterized protein (TIGR02145 family)